MEMQDRSSFEKEWEKAFAEAESSPSEKVWNKLELDLANNTNGMYRRRLNFFKILAAASIFFAFSVGGVAVYLEFFRVSQGNNMLSDVPVRSEKGKVNGAFNEDNKSDNAISENGVVTDEKETQVLNQGSENSLADRQNQQITDGESVVGNLALNQKSADTESKSDTSGKIDQLTTATDQMAGMSRMVEANADENLNSKTEENSVASIAITNDKATSLELNGDSKLSTKSENTVAFSGDEKNIENKDNSVIIGAENVTSNNKLSGEGSTALLIEKGGADNSKSLVNTSQVVALNEPSDSEVSAGLLEGNENIRKGGALASLKNSEIIPDYLDRIASPLDVNADISDPDLKMVPWYAKGIKKKQRFKKLWAGLGVSRGSFDPNGLGTEENSSAALQEDFRAFAPVNASGPLQNSSPSISNETRGSSLNIGINAGVRISKRWTIQSGLSYLEQNTSSSSNLVSIDNVSRSSDPLVEFNDQFSSANDFVIVENYDVSNSYKSVSVPIQAGYILVDRKFNVTLLGGISNDLLLGKSIKDDTGNLETVVLESNDVSNLNFYNISGTLGSELGYSLGDNYSISLNPQVKQSINSFNQSGDNSESRPISFELGFRLKYLFK